MQLPNLLHDDENTHNHIPRIHYLKLALLTDMSHIEVVKSIAEFVAIFYVKSFLQSALRPEAPFNDLNLIKGMREYAKHQPEVVVQPLMF